MLKAGAKGLSKAPPKQQSKGQEDGNEEQIKMFTDLYNKHDGDIRKIFDSLNENPRKCLKYPPKDDVHFAEQYVKGMYTYIEDADASAESK